MSNRRTREGKDNRQKYYVDGNTVRKLETLPQHEQEQLRQRQEKRRLDRTAKANRERAMRMNPGYVFFLTLAVMAIVFICTGYIWLQSGVNVRMNKITSLKKQVMDLKIDNDSMLKKVDASIDLEKIKKAALSDLGMVYPDSDQIIYYHVENDDYVNQYQEIPEK